MTQTVILLTALLMLLGLAISAFWRTHRHLPTADLPAGELHPPAQPLRARIAVLALSTPRRRLARVTLPPHTLPLLHQALRCRDAGGGLSMLQENARAILAPMMLLRKQLRPPLRLPALADGTPRMVKLCRELLRQTGQADGALLLTGLDAWQEAAATTLDERESLPQCMRVALAEQLRSVLADMLADASQRRQGALLSRRMTAARHPMALLNGRPLTPPLTAALLTRFREEGNTALLSALQARLAEAGLSEAVLLERQHRRQVIQADRVRRILSGLRALSRMDWPALSEEADPLHRLLNEDPAKVYPRMDQPSRRLYRSRVALLARRFGTEEHRTAAALVSLCRTADPDGLADHVGWYLLEAAGIQALRQRLHAPRGLLWTLCIAHGALLRRLLLILWNVAAALLFLGDGGSLLLLPFFLGVSSAFAHLAARVISRRKQPLPRMAIPQVTEEQRTLIVLPAVVKDASHALMLTRHLLCCRRAFPPGAIDCLLLGDHGDSMTLQSGEDEQLLRAARMAVTALDTPEERFLYLHRRRAWSRDQHAYIGRERRRGALETLNRLIVQGECEDAFDEATFAPGFLHRRYACVFVLTEDAVPAPDSLLPLMGALFHPLNERRRLPGGVRGVSLLRPLPVTDPAAARTAAALLTESTDAPAALYRPDTLLEATEGMIPPESLGDSPLLEDLLAGCSVDSSATVFVRSPSTLNERLRRLHRRTGSLWLLLPFLLPWIKTAHGVKRNPLSAQHRAQLREALRPTLLPLCRLVLMLYGVGARLPLCTLMAVLCPAFPALSAYGWRGLLRLCLLPVEAAVQADAQLRALWHMLVTRTHRQDVSAPASWGRVGGSVPLEWWSQGICAVLAAGLALMRLPPDVPGLLLGALFALFPVAHTRLDAPLHQEQRADETLSAALMDTAAATWRYFEETVTESSHFLPPESLQLKPWRGLSDQLRPEDAGLYLLSCLAARELGLIDTDEAARRIARTAEGLSALPLWHGLPYERYDAATLSPLPDARISAEGCGVLCGCLLCVSQGMRALLEEMDAATRDLPDHLDALADAMELHRLYDPTARLFRRYADPTGASAADLLPLYAAPSLLLSFLAVMRREVPLAHFAQLDRTCVRTGSAAPLMSEHGGMSEYLTPWVLLPLTGGTLAAQSIKAVLRAQRHMQREGVFGLSECRWWGFTAGLTYRHGFFGVPALACEPTPSPAVIAPYAAELALPHDLLAAGDCLLRLRALAMGGRLGYFESLDLDARHLPEGRQQELVQCHVAGHQALGLCSICNALTDRALVRHFTALPVVSAFAPLLREPPDPPLILPPALLHPPAPDARPQPWRRNAQTLTTPIDAQLIGSPEACMAVSAQGMGMMRARGLLLTPFTGDPGEGEGIRFFIRDRDVLFQPTDPTLPGETVFEEGLARFTRTAGEITATLTAAVDPARSSFVHLLELTNLSVQEKTVEVADCLIPCLAPQTSNLSDHRAFRTARPGKRLLTVTREDSAEAITLCHALSTHAEVLALTAETDRLAFQERDRDPAQPAALDAPMAEGFLGASSDPCAAFRLRLHLGGRGHASLMFVTRLAFPGETVEPEEAASRISDAEDIMSMSRLHSRVMTDGASLSPSRAGALSRLFGALLWRLQPHQGALSPLRASAHDLRHVQLDPEEPLLTVIISSEAGIALCREALSLCRWMRLMGVTLSLCVLCEGDRAEDALQAAEAALAAPQEGLRVLLTQRLPGGLRDAIEALSRLILFEGAGTADEQVAALQARCPAPAPLLPLPTPPALPRETLLGDNGLGGFHDQSGDYVLRLSPGASTPLPWSSPLTGEGFGTMVLDSGLGFSWAGNGLLTPVPRDPLCPVGGEMVLLQDDAGHTFSPTGLPMGMSLPRRVTHAPGVTTWQSWGCDVAMTLTAGCIPGRRGGLRTLRFKDQSGRDRHLTCRIALRFVMGSEGTSEALTCLTPITGGAVAVNPAMAQIGFLCVTEEDVRVRRVSVLSLRGLWAGTSALLHDGGDDPCGTAAILTRDIHLPAGGSASVTWLLGAAKTADDIEALLDLVRRQGASALLRATRQRWADRLGRLTVSTPDAMFDLLVNRVLPYQVRAAQLDARRSAFHPVGQLHFADHLLDASALLTTEPERVRAALLLCARHQYAEGDVQHVWLPPRKGLRTQLVTDRLMLPLVTARYVRFTGDAEVLREVCPFLTGAPLSQGQAALASTPALTEGQDSLHAHCLRALTSVHVGPRGLPLENGRESVTAGMLYAAALRAYAPLCEEPVRAEVLGVGKRMVDAVEQFGWDGDRYVDGFTAEDAAIGSAAGAIDRVMLLPQCLSPLASCAPDRCARAMETAWQRLYDPRHGLLPDMLPPRSGTADFSFPDQSGGESTTVAAWALHALCALGWSEQAWTLLASLTPMLRADTSDKAARLKTEPYALPARLSVSPGQEGRGGGGTHRSGAALIYTAVVEHLLGFQRQGGQVRMTPMLPPPWEGFTLTWRFGGTTWHFMAGRDVPQLTCDGEVCDNGWVTLKDDGRIHQVRVPMQ